MINKSNFGWLLGWDLKRTEKLFSPKHEIITSSEARKFTGITKKGRHNSFPVLLEKEQESENGRNSTNCGSCPVICHQKILF